jgi:hypothetical protein
VLPGGVDVAPRWPLLTVLLLSSRQTGTLKRKCEDIFAYRNVDGGRTYGPEDRCCLFLTGPVRPAVSDVVMFMRSSKVVILDPTAEYTENERKEKGGVAGGG